MGQAAIPLQVAPRSLAAAFASAAYPLAAVLSLAVAAVLANGLPELASRSGARQPDALPADAAAAPLQAGRAGDTRTRGYPAFCHGRGVVLAKEPTECGEEKSEADLTVAPAQVAGNPCMGVAWPGSVLTGDALFCQRKLPGQVLAAGGNFLVLIKEHQPTLLAAIILLFNPPAALGPAALVASSYAIADDELLAGYRRCYVAGPFGNRMELLESE